MMDQNRSKMVCPVENAGGLDSALRKFLHNPKKILSPYIKDGMTVLDVGCGPGVFSVEMAKMVGEYGHVIAADLQDGMLQILRAKISGTNIEKRIEIHKCEADRTGVTREVDFISAFYMVHEVPNKIDFLHEMRSLLKHDGRMLIVEPNFHVSGKEFRKMIDSSIDIGFELVGRPKIFFSRAVLLQRKD